jgi:4-amino-4-deoxy-L-arabinose transferase-like glycosyltransferase
MALNAIPFILLSRLYRKTLLLKIVTALFLAVNLILTFTDQMGLFDYIVLALNIVTLICFMIAVTKGRQKNES